jgi:hypothetical protein
MHLRIRFSFCDFFNDSLKKSRIYDLLPDFFFYNKCPPFYKIQLSDPFYSNSIQFEFHFKMTINIHAYNFTTY